MAMEPDQESQARWQCPKTTESLGGEVQNMPTSSFGLIDEAAQRRKQAEDHAGFKRISRGAFAFGFSRIGLPAR